MDSSLEIGFILATVPVLLLLIFFFILRIIRGKKSRRVINSLKIELTESQKDICDIYYNRAGSYKIQAYILLSIVICFLLLGTLIFYTAGQIAGRDLYYANSSYNNIYKDKFTDKYVSLYCLETQKEKPSMYSPSWDNIKKIVEIKYGPEILADMIEHENAIRKEKTDEKTFTLISTSTIRIGIIALIIFIVQIFLRLYRYKLKLSDFYEARYDAILISSTHPNLDFEKSISIMYPNFDVGKEVKTPMADLIDMLKNLKDITK